MRQLFSLRHIISGFFYICALHLAIIKVFYYQLMHKKIVLKRSIKISIKRAPTCDHTETSWSSFNVNFYAARYNNSLVHQLVIKNFVIISVFFVFEAFIFIIVIWLRKDRGIDIAYSELRSFECQRACQYFVIFLNFWRQMQGKYLG